MRNYGLEERRKATCEETSENRGRLLLQDKQFKSHRCHLHSISGIDSNLDITVLNFNSTAITTTLIVIRFYDQAVGHLIVMLDADGLAVLRLAD